MKHFVIALFVCAFLFGLIATIVINKDNQALAVENSSNWNNGECELCGGAYKFRSATYVHGVQYYYACDKCDHVIMTRVLQK